MAKRTQKEITRLVRVARSLSSMAVRRDGSHEFDPAQREYTCPVHLEALRRAGEERHTRAHTFVVHVLPWEDPTKVAAVTKALVSHLEDNEINGEPCEKIN
jgi:hypothetical protein